MDFNIGGDYEMQRALITFKLRRREVESIKVEKSQKVVCYFCNNKIVGEKRKIEYDDGMARDNYYLHLRCCRAAILGEMDFFD